MHQPGQASNCPHFEREIMFKWQKRQLRDDLVGVKAIIETHGWVPNRAGSPAEGFCLLGAISHWLINHELDANERRGARIEQHLQKLTVSPIQYWNDTVGRTPNEVVTLLERAIQQV